MASPDYTVKDLVFWTGLIGGLAVVSNMMKPLGYPQIVNILVGGVAGMILGGAALKLYEAMQNKDHESQTRYNDEDDGPTF